MIIKTILPSSYSYTDSKLADIIPITKNRIDKTWAKSAGVSGAFKNLEITPKPGKSYIHLIAMGATEYWSQNRNGDAFLEKGASVVIPFFNNTDKSKTISIEKGLIDTYLTFEKEAHVFREHNHFDVSNKEGDVYKAAYCPKMHRVELIIEVPTNKWGNELHKLASGEDVGFSMSCRVPYDICRICGNKSKSRAEYCDHASNHMGEILKSGHMVGVYNDHMTFFDISLVATPADRIAYGLAKVASASAKKKVLSGAELAELFGIAETVPKLARYQKKLAMLSKLSAIEKIIEGIAPSDSEINKEFAGLPEDMDLPCDLIQQIMAMPRSDIPFILGELADMKICLSLKDLLRIIMGSKFNEVESACPDAEAMLPGIFTRMLGAPRCISEIPEIEMTNDKPVASKIIVRVISLKPKMSFDLDEIKKRSIVSIIKGNSSGRLYLPDGSVKESSVKDNSLALSLAKVYALYKLALCERWDNDMLTKFLVASNYLRRCKV